MNTAATALLTDLYQLTMAHAYYELGMHETAVFELFTRRLPPSRRFLVAAGLAQIVEYLERLHFTASELEFLASTGLFPTNFLGGSDVQIILSGNLDEYRIAARLAADTPVNAFAVGTNLDVSADAPAMDMAYKLEEYAGQPRLKRSPGKLTWPGAKQVFRARDSQGRMRGDLIALADEDQPGEPLLREVMRDGHRVGTLPQLVAIREYCGNRVAELPVALRRLEEGDAGYEVEVSLKVRTLAARV